jgi:hypothetical protein
MAELFHGVKSSPYFCLQQKKTAVEMAKKGLARQLTRLSGINDK